MITIRAVKWLIVFDVQNNYLNSVYHRMPCYMVLIFLALDKFSLLYIKARCYT